MHFRTHSETSVGALIVSIIIVMIVTAIGFFLMRRPSINNGVELKGNELLEILNDYSRTKVKITTRQGTYMYDPEALFIIEIIPGTQDTMTEVKIKEK